MKKKQRKLSATILLAALILLSSIVLRDIFSGLPGRVPVMHFLDIGQGDAEVISLPGGVNIMTDAGPDVSVVDALGRALGGTKKIDLAIISHPQLDHFNGYNFLIDHYSIGAFVINGRDDGPGVKEWPALLQKIKEKGIPLITLKKGDKIHYGQNLIKMLSPGEEFIGSGELNDTGLLEYVSTTEWTALLTADTGMNIEDAVFATSSPVDILKVGHHGSKYSTGDNFLRMVRPRIAVISVAKKNTYGHPAPSTLARLANFHIPIFRTDEKGSIAIWRENNELKVRTEK